MPPEAASPVSHIQATTISAPQSAQSIGKPVVIEIAKIPDGKLLDPHWTAYLSAVGTPIVAVIAAAIAASIQYRQWQTAKAAAETARKKLKLDLFDKRFDAYMAVMQILIPLGREKNANENQIIAALSKTASIDFLFNEKIRNFYRELTDHVAVRMQIQIKLNDPSQREPSDTEEHLRVTLLDELQWFQEQRIKFENEVAPYLRVTH